MAEPIHRQSSTESHESQSNDCIAFDIIIQPQKSVEKSTEIDTIDTKNTEVSEVSEVSDHPENDNTDDETDEDMLRTMRAMLLLQLLEHEESFEYIPEIVCPATASNGLLPVQITNIDHLMKNGKFDTPLDKMFQLVYRFSCSKQNQYAAARIVVGNMNCTDNFQIKLPLHLNEYQFQFAVRAINVKTDDWLEISPLKTVNVPSMLVDTAYEVGDSVLFREENSYHGHRGVIQEILADNKYKVGYFMYDESKGSRDDEAAWVEHIHIVDKCRVFRKGTAQRQQIDLTDIDEIEKQMLLKTNDESAITVFRTLMDFYQNECLFYCVQVYGFQDCIIYYRAMAQFISKNVFDCLYAPEEAFQYKVNCLVDPYADGKLVLNHLREYTIRRYYMEYNGLASAADGHSINDIVDDISMEYQCDMCYGGINQFEYVFNCSHSDMNDRHDLCLSCVYTVIKLGTELEIWLKQLLKDQLNDDCVHEIVDYTVGRPIYIHYKSQN